MKFLRQNLLTLLILALILAAVLARTFRLTLFKYDAGRLAEPSALKTNIVTEDQLSTGTGGMLFVNLGKTGIYKEKSGIASIQVVPDSIIDRKYLDIIHSHKGKVILVSDDNSVTARVWMVLSQMGIKNLFILSEDEDPEILKKEFRPDTLPGPEF